MSLSNDPITGVTSGTMEAANTLLQLQQHSDQPGYTAPTPSQLMQQCYQLPSQSATSDACREWEEYDRRQQLLSAPTHGLSNLHRTEREHKSPRSTSPDADMEKFLRVVGFMSISDTAFHLLPFSGSANSGEHAEKWLEQFNMYTSFKKLDDDDKLRLFQLLMKDQARDWLASLPDDKKTHITILMDEFRKRHELTRVDKWKKTADIWKRQQLSQEPVDDYISSMQAAARRIKMSESLLADAIIQGMLPELRIYVLQSGAETIDQIVRAARVAEAAHSAADKPAGPVDKLTAKVEQLLEKFASSSTEAKKVTFAQAAITHDSRYNCMDDRNCMPLTNQPSNNTDRRTSFNNNRSTSRSPARQPEQFRRFTPTRPPVFNGHPTGDVRKPIVTWSSPQQRQPFRQSAPRPVQPTYNRTYNNTSTSSFQRRFTGSSCHRCGTNHPQQFCYASQMQCTFCGKTGHIQRVCNSRLRSQSNAPNNRSFSTSH
jgi:hypothetical protein